MIHWIKPSLKTKAQLEAVTRSHLFCQASPLIEIVVLLFKQSATYDLRLATYD